MTRRERAARSRDAAGLANSLRHAGTGTQRWLGARVGVALDADVGAGRARSIRSSRSRRRAIADGVADGQAAFIDDAHHAAHLEQPATSAAAR